MEKLYAVYLGGYAKQCNTELHDVVFVVGDTIENSYPQLVEKWFGDPKRLHIDSWMELDIVDGHRVILSQEKTHHSKKLFFVNFGAYLPDKFIELHENAFFVGEAQEEIKKRAKESLCQGLIKIHKDDLYDIDDLLQVDEVNGLYIHLEPTSEKTSLVPHSGYHALPKKIIEQ